MIDIENTHADIERYREEIEKCRGLNSSIKMRGKILASIHHTYMYIPSLTVSTPDKHNPSTRLGNTRLSSAFRPEGETPNAR